MDYKIPLILTPQPEGGFTITSPTSPALPELVTEGDSISEALDNAKDALAAVVEIYQDQGRPLPQAIRISKTDRPVRLETVVSTP